MVLAYSMVFSKQSDNLGRIKDLLQVLHVAFQQIADPGQYSMDPDPADVKKTDPDPG